MHGEWYKTWFDSPYYELLYRHRNHDEAQFFIDRMLHALHLPGRGRALDLACGTGRHAAYLHAQGFEVVGIDLSAKRIQLAQEQLVKPGDTRLRFVQADMRHLLTDGRPDWAQRPFDLIVNLFTSIGYFDEIGENQRVLANIRELIAPEGWLVIDFLNADKLARTLVPREEETIDGIHFEIRRQIENDHIVKRIRITDGDRMMHFNESVQLLHLRDFERLFKREHFQLELLWGDYSGAPFEEEDSDRLILFARPT